MFSTKKNSTQHLTLNYISSYTAFHSYEELAKNAKPKNDYKEKRRQKLLFYANNHDNGKQFSDAEKLTFVNLIKTMDPEGLLKANGWKEKSYEALAKRSVIWDKLVPAFNEICGTNCDVRRLKHALIRIKKTPHWKSHKLLFDLGK